MGVGWICFQGKKGWNFIFPSRNQENDLFAENVTENVKFHNPGGTRPSLADAIAFKDNKLLVERKPDLNWYEECSWDQNQAIALKP